MFQAFLIKTENHYEIQLIYDTSNNEKAKH